MLSMRCQKCAKPAVVHMTEVVSEEMGGGKKAIEIHLCLAHAVQLGLVPPGSEVLPQAMAADSAEEKNVSLQAIVPADSPAGGGLVLAKERGAAPVDLTACPVCGMNWGQFKQAGLMGCPHDYEMFSGKLLPLLKRAQEGATEHMGKTPAGKKTQEVDRQVTTLRLRRELQKAVDAENYESAARLRDQLRKLEQN